nr:reverse transcriptase domain-containing protein [Tanacetum cinerariifolium]
MADRTMEELLQAPTEGYGEAIVIPEILAENFEIKLNLLQDVPNNAIKLMLFPYSLEDRARICEAWDHFKKLLRACPHHGFSELTQIDTFYNGLTEQDQDSLNAASGGNLLNKTTREALQIIENKSKVRYSRSKSNVLRVNTNSRDIVSKTDDRIDKLADQISNLVEIVNKQVIAPAKAVEKTCVTCGGAHAYYECIAIDSNPSSVCAETGSYNQVSPPNRASHQIPPPGFAPVQNNPNSFFQNQPSISGTLPSNTVPNQKGKMKAVTTRSGLTYEGPPIPTKYPLEKVDEQNTEEILDKEHSNSSGSTAPVQPPVVPISILKPDVPRTQSKPIIQYPSSFADALLLMPKFASTIKSLLANKDKFFELAKVPLNENCSDMLLKNFQKSLEIRYNPKSSSPTLVSDDLISKSDACKVPIVKSSSPTLTPFGEGDFFLKEIKDFLNDDLIPSEIENSMFDPEGDILLIEKLLNEDPCQLPPMDLKLAKESKEKSSIEEPPELELKELTSHLEYAFLEDSNKLPVIIAKNLKVDEREALINVLKSHKQAIAWKIPTLRDSKPRLLRWVLLLQEFDITIGSENLAADHLSRLENLHQDVLKNKDINENFPLETLGSLTSHGTPWFADIANFHAGNFIKKGLTSQQKKKKLLKFSKLAMRDLQEAIIVPISQQRSDRGTHFCNDQFTRVMIKYRVTHRLTTANHLQMSVQVEVSNHGLKRILERTVGENHTSWSDKLDDALWAFRTAYKTPIGCTPYKLVYGKSCHISIELEHRAYWALKHVNFDLKTTGDHRKLPLNELSELCDQAYENSVIYKERTKKLHDSKIKNRIFNVGDQVLLFNSRLKIFSGKLKTCWFGLFTITRVFPYGTIELSQPNGPNFKVNGYRVKHYFGGEIPSNVAPDLHTFPMDN